MLNPYDIPLDQAMIRELASLEVFRVTPDSERAVEVLERAAAIDPLNPDFRFRRAVLLRLLGDQQRAVDEMRGAIVLSRYHIGKVGADILAMQADYEKRVVKEYAWKLSFSQLKPLLELVREADRELGPGVRRDDE